MTMPRRVHLFRLLTICAVLLVVQPIAADFGFEVSSVSVPAAIKHEILALFPDRQLPAAQLLVRRVDPDGRRYIDVFQVVAGNRVEEKAIASLAIDEDVILMDIGTLAEDAGESLILFRRDGAYSIDPVTGQRRELIRYQSMYQRPVLDELPAMELVYDLNGDELDDIVIPDFDGYRLYLQRPGNRFDEGMLMAAPAIMEQAWDENPTYRRTNLYRADINLDGLIDVLFWDLDKLQVYYQTEGGRFATEASVYNPSVEFHNEGLASLSFRMGDGRNQADIKEKLLFKLADLNSDGLPDLVTLTVYSKGVLNKSSTYDIFMGTRDDEGRLSFSAEPDSVIESNGIQFQLKELDFKKDGHTDLVVSSVQLGLAKILSALITGSISQDLAFYEMKEAGYGDKPGVVREVTTTFDLGSGAVFYPTVLITDVTGDSRVDLLVQDGDSAINIYEGIESSRLFAKSATKFKVAMPDNPDFVSLGDLNKDGKMDIMIRYGEPEDNLQNRVTVLFAQ